MKDDELNWVVVIVAIGIIGALAIGFELGRCYQLAQ